MKEIENLNNEYLLIHKVDNGNQNEEEQFEQFYTNRIKSYCEKSKISIESFLKQICNVRLVNDNINDYLFIKLFWDFSSITNKELGNLLHEITFKLLGKSNVSESDEYYIESYIDILADILCEKIDIMLLERIILMDYSRKNTYYGALIKAVGYLGEHSATEIDSVISKAKQTELYETDEYYKEWID